MINQPMNQSTKPMQLHHIGIAVESLQDAVSVFQRIFGGAPPNIETVEDQNARVAVFFLGNSRIELLEATSAESSLGRFIAKRGPGIHHLTLSVEHLDEALAELDSRGIRLIDREPRVGAEGNRIAFLHPKSTAGVLIELVEQ
jgi:methylmalonyl-CoA/ethylmalonyl-CoA epimerase